MYKNVSFSSSSPPSFSSLLLFLNTMHMPYSKTVLGKMNNQNKTYQKKKTQHKTKDKQKAKQSKKQA